MISKTFTGAIGFEVKGSVWACVNWPDSKQLGDTVTVFIEDAA